MVNKKVVAISTVIVIIIVAIIVFLEVKKMNNYENFVQNENNIAHNISSNVLKEENITNTVTENKIEENTITENIVEENKVEENKVEENTITENTIVENKVKENSASKNSSSKIKSEEKDPEKLAISLAKEKWGNLSSNVYFDVEDKNESKGIYTVVVRDSSTTVEMVTYKVDVNKKTVTE